MNPFPVSASELIIDGVPLTQFVARHATPIYLYSRAQLSARVAELRAVLPSRIGLHYSVKANPFPPLLNHMAGLVDGFDVASAGELTRTLEAGMAPARISFAGPGKRRNELEHGIAAGILFNAESRHEIATLAELGRQAGTPVRLALRINPAFELKGAGAHMGGGPRPFGIDEEEIPAVLADLHKDRDILHFEGFHIYAGSQNLSGDAIATTLRAIYALVQRLAPLAPAPVRSVNLGGGFGIPYTPDATPLDTAPIAAALAEIASASARELPEAYFHLELGRYLVGEAGIFVTRILDKKVSRGQTFLVTDGGLNNHIAATGCLGQVLRRNYPVAIGNRMPMNEKVDVTEGNPRGTGETACVNVVGPLCMPRDVLAEKVVLPEAEIGDLFVVFQSGAYGASASPQGFLSHPPVTEMLV